MKKLKSTWMTLLVAVLSVAMVISGMSLFALAAPAPRVAISGNNLVQNVTVVSKVKYGASFDVPKGVSNSDVKVKAPDGKDVTLSFSGDKASVKADQTGSYIVTYSGTDSDNNEVSYDFTVYSYMAEEYEIKVDHNGADIPTYMQKGGKISLPKAQLVWYDEDGDMQTVDNAVIKAVVGSGSTQEFTVSDDTADEYTAESTGLLYIRYYANLDNGKKFYTKDFTVKVQQTFTDNAAPTLSVVNVPREANINKKFTLPTATATDDFDENVKVVITVTLGGEEVKKVTVDADGFATGTIDEKEVFDNDKLMSFYPTELDATYKVTYQAFDDSGKSSAPYPYEIYCVDKSGPVFKSIDDFEIPEKWGLSVKSVERDENGAPSNDTETTVDTGISFPIPEVIDNAGTEGMAISFKMTNSANATVMSFENILDEKEPDGVTPTGKQFKSSGANYGTDGTFYTFGAFEFDFQNVKNTDPKADTYTVEYKAKDAKGNIATKTYKIVVENTYKDLKAPTTAEVETPDYIIADGSEETFVVPTPAVADAEAATTRLKVDYEMVSDASTTEGYVLKKAVKGGEEAKFIEDSGKYALEFEDGDKLLLNKNIVFNLKVTDNVGLSKSNKPADNTVKVILPANVSNDVAIIGDIKKEKTSGVAWTVEEAVKAGGFTIQVAPDNYLFTGFEVAVKNAKGETLNNVSLETYYDYYPGMSNADTSAKIVVRDLTFTPGTGGVYTVEVRAFNLAGKNTVAIYPIKVEGTTSGGGSTVNKPSAVSIPTSGTAYTPYKLKNGSLSNIDQTLGENEVLYSAHKISGAGFSLMGNEFIAYNQGAYLFADSYAVKNTDSAAVGTLNVKHNYSLTVSDSQKPVIEVQGLMPIYSPKKVADTDADVTLPAVVAVGEHGNAEISVTVTDKDGYDVTTTKSADGTYYTFEPTKDGAYTVVYTAVLNGSEPVTATFTINVGDVIAPDFTVGSTPAERMKINAEFKFSEISAVVDEKEDISDYTFTKKLIDPSKTEVVTISGKGTGYANKLDNGSTIKLDKSGTYTVVYEVSDLVGNKTTMQYQIVVSAQKSSSNVSLTMISTVLIIVGVILIAGVIIYFVRYRKRKPKDNK